VVDLAQALGLPSSRGKSDEPGVSTVQKKNRLKKPLRMINQEKEQIEPKRGRICDQATIILPTGVMATETIS
jgi:hypothetical protein